MQKLVDRLPFWIRRIICLLIPVAICYLADAVKTGIFANSSKNMLTVVIGTLAVPPLMAYLEYLFAPFKKVQSAKIALGICCFLGLLSSVTASASFLGGNGEWDSFGPLIMGLLSFFTVITVWMIFGKFEDKETPEEYQLDKFTDSLPVPIRWVLCVVVPPLILISGPTSGMVPWAFPCSDFFDLCRAVAFAVIYVTYFPYYLAPKKWMTVLLCWLIIWQVVLTGCVIYLSFHLSSAFPDTALTKGELMWQLYGSLVLNLLFSAVTYWISFKKSKKGPPNLILDFLSTILRIRKIGKEYIKT